MAGTGAPAGASLHEHLADIERPGAFRARHGEYNLLVTPDLSIARPNGRYCRLCSTRFVDPARQERLDDGQIVQPRRDRRLAWIHAHTGNLEAVSGDSEPSP